jgi:hypothetical protein
MPPHPRTIKQQPYLLVPKKEKVIAQNNELSVLLMKIIDFQNCPLNFCCNTILTYVMRVAPCSLEKQKKKCCD